MKLYGEEIRTYVDSVYGKGTSKNDAVAQDMRVAFSAFASTDGEMARDLSQYILRTLSGLIIKLDANDIENLRKTAKRLPEGLPREFAFAVIEKGKLNKGDTQEII